MNLPVGLDREADGRDRAVRATSRSAMRSTACSPVAAARLGAPGRRASCSPRASSCRAARVGERRVRWAPASYGAVHDFLTNPAYAGAFVFGRTRQEKRLDARGPRRRHDVELPIEEWSVCLPEHHPGYVSWAEYLATRERLRSNVRPRGEGGGAAREGGALLQGLLRCGRCGRRMQVAYSGTQRALPRYACVRGLSSTAPSATCQTLGGTRLDRAVADAFLEAVTPAGVAASAGAIAELEDQHEERLAGQRLALERAELEAGRARRQFDACEPEHRLVARTLERALEEALASVERERGRSRRSSSSRPEPLTAEERRALARLARDLPQAVERPRRRPTATARSCCARSCAR